MTAATPYFVPNEPGRWRAITLAAVVHAALFTFLWFGVRWQNETPIAIEAEVWSPQVREAAPQPEPTPEIKPEPQPVAKAIPKPVVIEPPVAKPDIVLEQEKKRKAKEQKEHRAREEEARMEKQRAEEKRIEKEKADVLARKRRDVEDLKKKETADTKRKEEAETQRLAKARDEEMRRITGGVTGAGGTGTAAKAQGSRGSAEYASRVGARIKSNTVFNVPDILAGNPPVEYAVELLPDGSIRRPIRKTKPSGVPGFDEAVLNAIEKSQPYPPDKSGTVPSSFNIIHRPKDQ